MPPASIAKQPTIADIKAGLKKGLPAHEWQAVEAWLSTFFPFQQEWLLDPTRFSILLKCRQIGASHTYAAAAVLWGLWGETTSFISIGEREGTELLEKAKLHCEALARLGSKFAVLDRMSATQLKMFKGGNGGGRILVLPATSGGRSYSGNVILDEFAYHKDAQSVWDGAAGTVMHGGKMRIASTPNGPGNLFYSLCTDPKQNEGFKIHKTTIDDAVEAGMSIDIQQCWTAAHGDPRLFDQLYRCSFLDNEQQYVQDELIRASVTEAYPPLEGDCYAGIDVGHSSDPTALVVVRVGPDGQRWVVHVETKKNTGYEDVEALAAFAFKFYKCRRLAIDETGMGTFPAQQLQAKYGRFRVQPVTFTLKSKEAMATTMYQHFVDRRININSTDLELRQDVSAIRRVVSDSGNVKYEAARGPNGHADRAFALMLALQCCSGPDRRRHELHDYVDE